MVNGGKNIGQILFSGPVLKKKSCEIIVELTLTSFNWKNASVKKSRKKNTHKRNLIQFPGLLFPVMISKLKLPL